MEMGTLNYSDQPIVEPEKYNPHISSFPCIEDAPKSGEIFRNDKGQYTFLCIHCGFTFQDFGETINHIETHFTNDVKWDIAPAPEFADVSNPAALLNPTDILLEPRTIKLEPNTPDMAVCPLTLPSSTNVPRRRGRKRKVSPLLSTPLLSEPATLSESILLMSLPHTSELSNPICPPRLRRRKKQISPMLNTPQNCPICGLWCDDLRGHLKATHEIKRDIYQCFMCELYCKNFVELKAHITLKHRHHTLIKCYHCEMEPPIENDSDPRRHKCLYCQLWFPNHVEFRIHFKEAHNKDADNFFHKRSNCNVFTCYICEKEFPLRYYLAAHMKIHFQKFLSHQCPTCGKRVRTYGQLTQHLKLHQGITYKCDQCDKEFKHFVRLRLHRSCHITETNYVCHLCSKAFKLQRYLTRHMAVHTNDRKFLCRYCDASFNFSPGRRAHEKSQHCAI